jgi:hypothetical protein
VEPVSLEEQSTWCRCQECGKALTAIPPQRMVEHLTLHPDQNGTDGKHPWNPHCLNPGRRRVVGQGSRKESEPPTGVDGELWVAYPAKGETLRQSPGPLGQPTQTHTQLSQVSPGSRSLGPLKKRWILCQQVGSSENATLSSLYSSSCSS